MTHGITTTHGKPASWVISRQDTGEAMFETFNESVANAVNLEVYAVTPIHEWLTGLNRRQ